MCSGFSKNTSKWINFQKSCINCNFSSKRTHKYLSWILNSVFWGTPLFQSTSFSEDFSVDVFISVNTLSIKSPLTLARKKKSNEIMIYCDWTTRFFFTWCKPRNIYMCLKENQKHFKTKLITKSIYISDY